jgi:hypothetical protein
MSSGSIVQAKVNALVAEGCLDEALVLMQRLARDRNEKWLLGRVYRLASSGFERYPVAIGDVVMLRADAAGAVLEFVPRVGRARVAEGLARPIVGWDAAFESWCGRRLEG